jgi:trehalose synthase
MPPASLRCLTVLGVHRLEAPSDGEGGSQLREVEVADRPIEALAPIVRRRHMARFEAALETASARFEGRTLWHVNSTSEGGGVAELLHGLLGYLVDGGVETRWLVLEGDRDFFRVTKRIHNRLHGSLGDGGLLDGSARRTYRETIDTNANELLRLVSRGDAVVLHDPQSAGLAAWLRRAGATVVWICHVGIDRPNDLTRSAWEFLTPEVMEADAVAFSRKAYVWEGLDPRKVRCIPPCIDPTSAKNVELSSLERLAILGWSGIFDAVGPATSRRIHGGQHRTEIRHPADTVGTVSPPTDAPLVLQVSRWDRLKDHVGVLRGFSRHVPLDLGAHLLLVGPTSVADDPESRGVLAEVLEAWEELPSDVRDRVHLAILPLDDMVENALVVNALQSHADVVVQKSLAEGFGLTVAEAMWKRRPVVGSRLGGIQDQIVDGESGVLIGATDLVGMGDAISSLIRDPSFAGAIGHRAHDRVRELFLPPHFLAAHLELIDRVMSADRLEYR